ncbi:hypothetical protein Agub_g2415 [Astrephomene gubernaculifera]|uniref:Pherophorin domain-containing protein n=1 Tax=Astrephomene gubernaculifera TaxID=47775 RepID=A0AAD3DKQ9_9CHLO|nr:hypothetical protein Agub_g2415 [Astrephomene gubernaculifera]
MRLASVILLLFSSLWVSNAASWSESFPYLSCYANSKCRYLVSPVVTNPAPNTYCFVVSAGDCRDMSNTCCSKGDIAQFALNASSSCDGASITATLDTIPISNVNIVRPPKAASNSSRLLLIPELHLNATSIRPNGSQLCITLPSSGKCSSLDELSGGRTGRWSASLLSSNGVCCPVSRGRTTPPATPKGACQTCIVYDILGPDGTAATTKYDFFTRNSCALPELHPEDAKKYKNCCDWDGAYVSSNFDNFRGPNGTVLSGFERPFCNRTSLRVCGTLTSPKAARQMLKPRSDNPFYSDLPFFFDVTDDSYPMAIYDSTLRVYTTEPGSDKLDTKCFPINDTWPYVYSAPSREDYYVYYPDMPHFPSEADKCQSDPGVTPFTVDPYLQVIWANTTNLSNSTDLYCITLATAEPVNASSTCGKTSSISRVSLWMYEDWKQYYLGAYLVTGAGSSGYVQKQLEMTWGPTGDNAMIISLPNGLDVPTVNATQPKVCVEVAADGIPLWSGAMDSLGYVWTALYDESGKCCPTYYTNRY